MMNKLQKVLSAAAQVISNSRKYDRGLTYTRRRATLVRHPWTYSVPNCSHCSSLSEWSAAYLTELCTLSHRAGRAVAYGCHIVIG